MVRRLLVGLFLGLIVGALVAAGFVRGLGILTFGEGAGGALFAYASAAVTGVLTGLVAGKPIWASGAKIEAGLKAFFGALLAAGLMFALRQWAEGIPVPVTAFTPENLHVGDLPAVALPVLAAALGGFFGLDNTGGDEGKDRSDRKRVADGASGKPGQRARVASGDEEDEDTAAAAPAPKRAAKR